MNRLWLLASIPALTLGALGLGGAPERPETTLQYRCAEGRVVIATQRHSFVSLIVRGNAYELTWQGENTAKGHGLEWRINADGRAALKRASSGYELVSACIASSKSF
jgi:hypothetical protein